MILNPQDGPGIYSVSPDSDYEVHTVSPNHGLGLWGDRARQFDNGDDSTPTTNAAQGWPTWDAPVPTFRPLWWSMCQTYATGNSVQGCGWQPTGAGSGSTQGYAFDATYGVYAVFNTGTTTTGWRSISFGASGASCITFWTNTHQWRYETAISIPTLSNGTDAFTVFAGFNASGAAPSNDRAIVRVNDGVTNFQCECALLGTATTVDSGIPCVAGTAYRVVIVSTNLTQQDFYICQVGQPLPATPTVTITTNLPSHGLTALATIVKSAGTNNRALNCYYQLLSMNRLVA